MVRSSPTPRIWWGVGAATASALAAGLAAILAPDGHFAFGVESASSASTALIRAPSVTFPQIYAFFAGTVAALNPCGVALLPGYLGLYLRGPGDGRPTARALFWTPVKLSLAVTAAFLAAFGLVGLAVGLAGATVSGLFPWLGLLIGVLLIVFGGAVLAGGTVYGGGQAVADRLGGVATRGGLAGYFAYGLAYALASLGCALPLFLAVVGSTLLARGWLGKGLEFVLYGLGMAVTLTVLTIVAAVFKAQLVTRLRSIGRAFEPISAGLLLVIGAYVTYYWLTLGGLLRGAG